jgi:DNA repair protein RadC
MMTDGYFDQLSVCDNDFHVVADMLAMIAPTIDRQELIYSLQSKFKTLPDLLASNYLSLTLNNHLGESGALLIKYTQILLQRSIRSRIKDRDLIKNIADLNHYLLYKMPLLTEEHIVIFLLDAKNYLIQEEILAKGITNEVFFHPKSVVRKVIEVNASAFILVHNHPSGDPHPSKADIESSISLMSICNELSIVFHDHVIVGMDKIFSMKSANCM